MNRRYPTRAAFEEDARALAGENWIAASICQLEPPRKRRASPGWWARLFRRPQSGADAEEPPGPQILVEYVPRLLPWPTPARDRGRERTN